MKDFRRGMRWPHFEYIISACCVKNEKEKPKNGYRETGLEVTDVPGEQCRSKEDAEKWQAKTFPQKTAFYFSRKHTCIHTHIFTHIYTYTETHAHTCIYTYTYITHAFTHIHNTNIYTYTYTHMHIHTCTYTHTRTHMHTLNKSGHLANVAKPCVWTQIFGETS